MRRSLAALWTITLTGCSYSSAAQAELKPVRLLAVIGFVGFLWCINSTRAGRRLRQRQAVRLEERNRIARELHDTLLQSTEGLILKVYTVVQQLPSDDPTRLFLTRSLEQAESLAFEGRRKLLEIENPLRSQAELCQALAALGVELSADTSTDFFAVRKGRARRIAAAAWEELFSIAREAISNGFKHAAASCIDLTVIYGFSALTLRVSDDGNGMTHQQKLGLDEGRMGVRSMRERAAQLGAGLAIEDSAGGGTTVTLTVPAQVAYRCQLLALGTHFPAHPRITTTRFDD
ncbi:MAG TPA: ATP-binding protein [Steroidobacteraceae bacterium]